MTSPPPPILPPIRSLGIDLPASLFAPENNAAAAALDSTTAPVNAAMDINDANREPQVIIPGIAPPVPVPSNEAQPVDTYVDERSDSFGEDHDDNDDHEGHDDDNDDNDGEDGEIDEDSSDDDEQDGGDEDPFPWYAVTEDTSTPCDDEQAFIDEKEEYSACDHSYWEAQTFFDLDDPDIKPGAHGRIEWSISAFNGTKEKPNKQLVMKSPIVRIGEHLWQIKMYPKGDRTEFISVYIECLTLSKPEFVDQVDFKHPPLPAPASTPKLKRRVSVAAQVAVVMYNPAEPRTYEYKIDAHQFHKHKTDFGWKYFSREPRYEFHMRRHGQRQAILRNDKLAMTAYIRIVNDPTGCLWETAGPAQGLPTPTSLVPFEGTSPRLATYMLLFHLGPFRRWLYTVKATTEPILFLQAALIRFMARKLKRRHLRNQGIPTGGDIVSVLHGLRAVLMKEQNPLVMVGFDALFGDLTSPNIPIAHNRLETSNFHSIQESIDKRGNIDTTPSVLTIELERQRFNKHKRKWEKVNNPVLLEDTITYGGINYSLYAFVTHTGALGSVNYVPYVRPGGPGELWYAYESYHVSCLTQKAALDRQCGIKSVSKMQPSLPNRYQSPPPIKKEESGTAYLAMYVRQEMCTSAFAAPAEENISSLESSMNEMIRAANRASARSTHDRAAIAEVKLPHASSTSAPPPWRQPPIGYQAGIMDGDDVIMSDAEDDAPSQSYINSSLQEASSAPTANNQDDNPQTYHKCINYFAGPFYDGTTLLDGKFHGHGHLISLTGDEYTGDFKHHKQHGNGTMIYGQTGDKYTGEWADGQHHGHGKLVEKSSGNVFEGGWQEGRRHGSFVLRGTVTDDDKQYCQICYDREMNVAFYDCGHVLACKECAAAVQQCPVCRKQVLARLELFGVKVSVQ